MEASSELWALEGSVKERRRSGLQHFLWMGFEPTLLRDLEREESCLWAATREGKFFQIEVEALAAGRREGTPTNSA
jgi:hypothetical protein